MLVYMCTHTHIHTYSIHTQCVPLLWADLEGYRIGLGQYIDYTFGSIAVHGTSTVLGYDVIKMAALCKG